MAKLRGINWQRLLPLGIGLLLAGLAIPLRFYHLAQVSPDFHFDEGFHAMDALGVLRGEHALFFPANRGREGLIVYAVAGAIKLFGPTVFAVRFPTALASVASVFALFWFGQILFRPSEKSQGLARWRGIVIAGVAAGTLAVSLSQSILGRAALRGNFLPLLLSLGFGLLWSGIERRKWGRLLGAGLCVGLMVYTYIPARLAPVLLLSLGLTFVAEAWWRTGTPGVKRLVRSHGGPVLVFVGMAGLVAAPMLGYYAFHPESLISRSDQIWLFSSSLYDGNILTTLGRNIWNQVAMMGLVGDPHWRANFDSWPMLNPATALFFWIGVGVALRRWRIPIYRLLLLWLGIMLIPAVLSFDLPHNTLRMIGMIPAIHLCIGLGLWESLAWIQVWLDRTALPGRRLFVPGILGLTVVAIMAQGLLVHQVINQRWAPALIDKLPAPNLEWRALVDRLNALPPGTPELVVIPYVAEDDLYAHSSFAFLNRGVVPVVFVDPSQAGFEAQLQAEIEQSLPAGGTVKVVSWEREPMADSAGRLPFLLGMEGVRTGQEAYTDYTVTTFTDLDLASTWRLPAPEKEMAVTLDCGLSLVGIGMVEYGGRPLPLSGDLPVDFALSTHPALGLVVDWQAIHTPNHDYRLSLRLTAADGTLAFQQDDGLWNAAHRLTSAWQPGEQAESLHLLTLPPDLAPGVYELRAVVYDQESLTPTVQVGSWQPEIVLARLRIG